MDKKYKIAVFSYWSAIYDCCTVQRLQFPLSKLQEDNKIEVDFYLIDYIDMLNQSKLSFDSFISKEYDFVILHRIDIAFSFVLTFVKKLQGSNIKIIHELDDLFYSSGTEENDKFLLELYNQPNTSLICATHYLRNIVEKVVNNNIFVYTTKFPDREFNKLISTGSDDLLIIGTDRHLTNYEKLWNDHLSYCTLPIHFFGFKPNYVGIWTEDYNVKHTKLILNYFGYINRLLQIKFNFGLVYLQENNFNYSKSPIKVWEYAYSGHLALFSNCPVYSSVLEELPELLVNENEWSNKIHWLRNMDKTEYNRLLIKFQYIAKQYFNITQASTQYYFDILTTIKNG